MYFAVEPLVNPNLEKIPTVLAAVRYMPSMRAPNDEVGTSRAVMILATAYLRLLSRRLSAENIATYHCPEDSRESGQNPFAIRPPLIADVQATDADNHRPGEEAP
jgi:hypothetical protein